MTTRRSLIAVVCALVAFGASADDIALIDTEECPILCPPNIRAWWSTPAGTTQFASDYVGLGFARSGDVLLSRRRTPLAPPDARDAVSTIAPPSAESARFVAPEIDIESVVQT